ncbi:neurotrimin-like isoform X2 [Achroia grisella]|uniref:neurotrimin-like isoform X2 n=1 Tax=Achroia grisella TaxID=688607 RepID=UPI0027D24086|nr:neurotrimin-like isoform X2 [Achroia grisella]
MAARTVWMLCALLVLLLNECSSVNGHVVEKREASDEYDFMGDDPSDDDTLNDAYGEGEEGNTENIVIVTKPQVYNVSAGSTVILECNVEPKGNSAVVQWLRNDNIYFLGSMTTLTDHRIKLVHNTSMAISNVTPSDEGEYKCVVTQKKPLTLTHRVVVTSKPNILDLSATNNGRVHEGNRLVLNCDVSGSPPPKIVWSRQRKGSHDNERLLETDGVFSLNSVTIEHVKPEHSGTYYCYAFNGVAADTRDIQITVLYKPRVHVHRQETNTALNVRTELQCSAHGEPAPYLSWYKDNQLINEGVINDDSHTPLSTLVVVPKSDSDFGTYTCVAINSHGRHNSSVELVQRPVVEDVEADGAKVAWKVHSHLPLEAVQIQAFPFGIDESVSQNPSDISVSLPQESGLKLYEMSYEISSLPAGKYEAIVKAKNSKGWSREPKPVILNIVFRGAASMVTGSTTLLLTTLTYLLVRKL